MDVKIALIGHQSKDLKVSKEVVQYWMRDVVDYFFMGHKKKELICGGTDGAGEMFGLLKRFYQDALLKLYLPIPGYRKTKMDPRLKYLVDITYTMSDEWHDGLNTMRDRAMINECDILMVVWNGKEEGEVWKAVSYARVIGKPIVYFPQSYFED